MKRNNILLVEPARSKKYHTPYPPLGLLKLAAHHKRRRDRVTLVQGLADDGFQPDIIYITSLFTYAYEPVHETIRYYRNKYRRSRIVVGGIYATLCPDHLRKTFGDSIEIHEGLFEEAENLLPDYSLVPDWGASLLFSSRGCIRNCRFCSVPLIEPEFKFKGSIKRLIYPGHTKAIFWDNNILASPHWETIFDELLELGLETDFNQGLDARLLTENVAVKIKRLRIPVVRLAYDSNGVRESLQSAVALLKNVAGVRGRDIIVYCLYNHLDTPEDFLNRLKDILQWGVVAYPMRYEPTKPRAKNTYVSRNWTGELLEMVSKARRVIGFGGAFPPYEGLKKKFLRARTLRTALRLRAPR